MIFDILKKWHFEQQSALIFLLWNTLGQISQQQYVDKISDTLKKWNFGQQFGLKFGQKFCRNFCYFDQLALGFLFWNLPWQNWQQQCIYGVYTMYIETSDVLKKQSLKILSISFTYYTKTFLDYYFIFIFYCTYFLLYYDLHSLH